MTNVLAFSGGKDSTALACLLKDRGIEFVPVFCDTKWESDETYQYIKEIDKTLFGGTLVYLSDEEWPGMLPMIEKKGRVPSARARFCTERLKIIPMIRYIKKLAEETDDEIVIYQGIRADESSARSKMQEEEWSDAYDCMVKRPLFRWTAEECFDLTKKHGIEPNPLYKMGARRVGCFPCVMITLGELKRLNITYPAIWDRMAQMEKAAKGSSFFPPNYIPKRFQTGWDPKSEKPFPKLDDVKKYILDPNLKLWDEPVPTCMSIYNLCE